MQADGMIGEIERLKARVASLERLLEARDQTVVKQAGRIEAAMNQISAQSEVLHTILTGTASATGDHFFHSIVSHLASALKVRYALVGEVVHDRLDRIRTFAVCDGEEMLENLEYDLKGTPCAEVINQNLCYYERGVRELFPDDRLLADMGVESYCGTPLFDRSGRVLGILVVLHDQPMPRALDVQKMLTVFAERAGAELERKCAEEALRASEERYRMILASALDGFWVIDVQGNILEVNDAYCRLTGYRRDELLSMKVGDVEASESPKDVVKHIQAVQEVGGDRFETRHRCKGGAIIDVEVSVRYVNRDGGRFFSFFRDITARKRAEESLQQAGERVLKQESALFRLTKSETLRTADLTKVLRHITEAAAQTLMVERVSVWYYSEDRRAIQCANLYELSANRHSSGVELRADFYPAYFHALASSEIVAADDAHQDTRTREFSANYLSPLGISSMMDVPIYLFGRLEGVICHEHVGPSRRWMQDEQMFAMALANLISLAYEQWERKRVEEALRESEARFKDFMDNSPAMAWLKDEQGRYVYVNKPFEHRFRMRLEDFRGRTDFDVFPLETARQFCENDQAVLTAGSARELSEFAVTSDGEHHDWWVVRFPFRDASGMRYVGGMALDITERKRTETALRESEERLRIALNAVRMGIWDWNIRTNEVKWSDNVKRIYGVFEGTFAGSYEAYLTHVHPDDREMVVCSITDCIEQGAEYSVEHRVVWSDQSLHWVTCKGDVVRDDAGNAVRMLGTVMDITDRKRLEDQLRHSQKMEAVGRLAGGVAHDFNNLLTVITGYSKLLLSQLGPEDGMRDDVEGISQAGDRAAALTRQLLAFSRRQVVQLKVLDVNVVVTDLVDMLQRLIGEDIHLVTRLDPSPAYVKFDPGQLEQVLVNLSVNARDAMPDGGTLTIETIDAHDASAAGIGPADQVVRLIVHDTGCGMDADTLSHIFEPFFTTKELGKGTGLGLATVYGIVTQSGGTIEASSVPGQGTTFTMVLPRVDVDVRAAMAPVTSDGSPRGTETILLVEDQSLVRQYVRDVLKEHGYHLLEAESGEEALRYAEEHRGRIDLLLTDVVMPRMSGRHLSEAISSTRPSTKVLFMSGYAGDTVLRDEVLKGAAFLQKPIAPDVLLSRVRELLDTPLERSH